MSIVTLHITPNVRGIGNSGILLSINVKKKNVEMIVALRYTFHCQIKTLLLTEILLESYIYLT